ncbi:membrane protease YdiL (CAAX protease family) [Paenibacillus anaericanus]|uniref:DUF4129 domain-containing protein n=1 Tax=Paenibacillus anaericanus TaxID=170367 RepID=UPI0027803ECC|nr:DUF4129 domain-containing protein [Paenibacillus anaericanus]MDQ0089389.1 membrane protease YdiL (CAAX protease family) [Paenibacillus anaericanus]
MNSDTSVYINRSFRLWLSCLMEIGLCLPLWIMVSVYLLPAGPINIIWISGLLLFSFVGVMLRRYLQVMWKRLGAAVLLGLLFGILVVNGTWIMLVWFCFSGAFCALQGMTASARLHDHRLYGWGIMLYLVSSIFFPRIEVLQIWWPLLTWTGVATLVLTLFITNVGHLRSSTLSDETTPNLPEGLRRHNRIYMAVIVIVAALLAAGAGKWISSTLWRLVKAVVGWLTRESPVEPVQVPEEEAPPAMEPFLPQEVSSPGLLSEILNIMAYVIGALIVAGLVALLIYWLYKNVGGFWRKSIDSLLGLLRRRGRDESSTSYHDEEKNIFSWESVSKRLRDIRIPFTRIGRSNERWEDMGDNKERVRYLYRRLLRSELGVGYEPRPGLTPLEQEREFKKWLDQGEAGEASTQAKAKRGKVRPSTEPLVNLYYRVRYGEERPDDAEIAAIRDKLKL